MRGARNVFGAPRWRETGAIVASAALALAMGGWIPAQAATIPTPPATCQWLERGQPVVTSFSMSPTAIDVRTHQQSLSWSVHATDPVGSIKDVLLIVGPADVEGFQLTFTLNKLTSGTLRDGTWSGKATIPRYVLAGKWNVVQVRVDDKGGGEMFYSTAYGNWGSGWPSSFTVRSHDASGRPTLQSLSLSSTSVSTAHGPARITVTAKVSDPGPGLPDFGVVVTAGPSGLPFGRPSATAKLRLHSGTRQDGTFTGTMVVPGWLGSGWRTWGLTAMLADAIGFETTYSTDELKQMHIHDAYQLHIVSAPDFSKPALHALAISTSAVNALAASKVVTVSVKATDTISGVQAAHVSFISPGGLEVTAPLRLRLGKATSGTWQGSVSIPRCSEPGTWTVLVSLTDGARHQVILSGAQLTARHLRGSIAVKALDAQPPGASISKAATDADPSFTVTFNEPTLWKDGTTGFPVTNGSQAPVAGTWVCANEGSHVVVCDADSADVVTATFDPTLPLSGGRPYEAHIGPESVFDTAGNPMWETFLTMSNP